MLSTVPAVDRPATRSPHDEIRAFWRHAADLERHMLAAGVMPEHADASQADFPDEVTDDLRAVWDRPGILIGGAVGRGKTRLAAALVRRHVLGGATARMLLAREFFMLVRDTYRDDSPRSELDVLREFSELDCLVLDDLAREGAMTPQVLSVLHLVLSKRIGHGRRTILTTNLSRAEIGRHYDPAIESRLERFGTVILDGEDRRRA